jgi:V-type H+-transporting ATPase proteolipid subunit
MPPILAGILSIYGLVVAVIISGDLKERLPIYSAFLQLGAGISVGLCGLAAGYVINSFPGKTRHVRPSFER